MKTWIKVAAVAAAAAISAAASASPFTVFGSLSGDPRPENPDNLFIDVKIMGDTTSNVVNWTVDINSPLHPNAKLDEFYFNVVGAAGLFSFSVFDPAGWAVSTPATTAGGGNIAFLFEALDPAGPPNADDVTNTRDLTFTMTKSSGNFSVYDFLDAASTCSNNATLGCGQLGAHLQSLNAGNGEADSGFLIGNYDSSDPPVVIPEPASLALVGLALAGVGIASRRRRSA